MVGADHYIHTSNTDVWLYGDVEGYRYWISLLKAAASGAPACRIEQRLLGIYSMSVLLQPRVRNRECIADFSERLLHRPQPVMELVINATTSGYRKMVEEIEALTDQNRDDPSDHLHLDRNTPWLTANSICLNIRGPKTIWNPDRAPACRPSSAALPEGWLDSASPDEAENLAFPPPVKFHQRWCRK